jgi:hypothetical protein
MLNISHSVSNYNILILPYTPETERRANPLVKNLHYTKKSGSMADNMEHAGYWPASFYYAMISS